MHHWTDYQQTFISRSKKQILQCLCYSKYKGNESPKHTCMLQNWGSSSSAMEQDIIVEGFCRSEKMHSLRYIGIIEDSSVYTKVVEIVPYGRRLKKLECAHHAV